jgi:indole-3-glycerol phosphate synthase
VDEVLATILASKRDEVARLAPAHVAHLERDALAAPPARDFGAALLRADGHVAVIGEIKRRSPSKGELAPDLDAARTAQAYEAGGVAAISVLTDAPFFGGSMTDLELAHAVVAVPVLRKDFTIDVVQLFEARAASADAVLLIVAALDDGALRELHRRALDLGLAVLVEAHDEDEVDRAVDVGARIIGVNARDLSDFSEDLTVGERLAQRIPDGVVRVAESAIREPGDAQRMANAGYHAVLVGEALVRASDPTATVRTFAAVRPWR